MYVSTQHIAPHVPSITCAEALYQTYFYRIIHSVLDIVVLEESRRGDETPSFEVRKVSSLEWDEKF